MRWTSIAARTRPRPSRAPPTIPASRTGTWPLSTTAPRRSSAPVPACPGGPRRRRGRGCPPGLLAAAPAGASRRSSISGACTRPARRSSCPLCGRTPTTTPATDWPSCRSSPSPPVRWWQCGAGLPACPIGFVPPPPPSSSPPEPSIGRLIPGPRTGSPGRNRASTPPAAARGPPKPPQFLSPAIVRGSGISHLVATISRESIATWVFRCARPSASANGLPWEATVRRPELFLVTSGPSSRAATRSRRPSPAPPGSAYAISSKRRSSKRTSR